jgi:Tol biopolymer transport system component
VNEQRLRDRMRDHPVPDEHGAEERSWRVVRAAYEGRQPATHRPRRLRVALAPAPIALLALALVASGSAIGALVHELVSPGEKHARPALVSLPSGGRLLVNSASGPWVVAANGSKRLLGSYSDAAWSPHGLFVVATQGRQLVAVQPSGRVRWTLARPSPVSDPRWSPSGYRIAYLTGPTGRPGLRVVAGDGTGDRPFARSVAPSPPAWQPGGALHVLAYADRAGSVRVAAVDKRVTIWRSNPGEPPRELVWSADGRRLLAVGATSVRIFDDRGRLLDTVRMTARAATFARAGHQFALVRAGRRGGQSEVVVLDAERRRARERVLFAGAGAFSDLSWSPDGRWVLIGWPSADQWLFIRSERTQRVVAVSNVARQFSPGSSSGAGFPRVSGWCCARSGSPG